MFVSLVWFSVAACLMSVRQKSSVSGPSLDGPNWWVKLLNSSLSISISSIAT